MLDFTYELGFFGFLLRASPGLFLFFLAIVFHLGCAKELLPNAPSPKFLAPVANDEELTERGQPMRVWTLGLYATSILTVMLIGLLTGTSGPEEPEVVIERPRSQLRSFGETPPELPRAAARPQKAEPPPPPDPEAGDEAEYVGDSGE